MMSVDPLLPTPLLLGHICVCAGGCQASCICSGDAGLPVVRGAGRGNQIGARSVARGKEG